VGSFKFSADRLKDPVKVVDRVVIPKPDDAIAMCCEFCRSRGVGCLSNGVLATIELDDQFSRRTGEIRDATTNRVLPTKFPAAKLRAQRTP
jgi:hypothetical protein